MKHLEGFANPLKETPKQKTQGVLQNPYQNVTSSNTVNTDTA